MSITTLAERSDTHRSHLFRIEQGHVPNLSVHKVQQIAQALGVSTSALLMDGPAVGDACQASPSPPEPERLVVDCKFGPEGDSVWLIELVAQGETMAYELTWLGPTGFVREIDHAYGLDEATRLFDLRAELPHAS
jgi:transcriptional regulator with XRE-family HTH domain